ncbi:Histone-lysine N-methyltransferase ezh1 [Binucleata daphniae]
MKPCSKHCFFITKDYEQPIFNKDETTLMQQILKTFQPSSCLLYLTLKYVHSSNVTCAQLYNITQKIVKNKVVYKKPVKFAKIQHNLIVHYNPCSHLGSCLRNKSCMCYNNKTYCELTCNCECCDMCFEPCNCNECDTNCWCYVNGRECTTQCHQIHKNVLDKNNNEKVNDDDLINNNYVPEHKIAEETKQNKINEPLQYNYCIPNGKDNIENKNKHTELFNLKHKNKASVESVNTMTDEHSNENDAKKRKIYTNNKEKTTNITNCGNKNILLKNFAKTYIGESLIAGFGLFALEDINKNQFVIEYVGELISHNEAERRGFFYDRKKISYLFDLSIRDDEDYGTIDATKIGNSSRFINHSINANVEARQMMVNGMLRMGFYTNRKIRSGEELFFDYKYNEKIKKIFNLKD